MTERQSDTKECAFIRLRGATERLLLIMQHRSERNYAVAMQAVEQTMMEYRTHGERSDQTKEE